MCGLRFLTLANIKETGRQLEGFPRGQGGGGILRAAEEGFPTELKAGRPGRFPWGCSSERPGGFSELWGRGERAGGGGVRRVRGGE